jgi:hypothetical protein
MATQMEQVPPHINKRGDAEIRIVSHSNLFYWWPVWVVGFIIAILAWIDGHMMVIVPRGTTLEHNRQVQGLPEKGEVDLLILPKQKGAADNDQGPSVAMVRVAGYKGYGVFFAIILLLIIVFTNVPLRGMWSVTLVVTAVLLSIILALAGWWEPILARLEQLHIYMNIAGYLVLSSALFVIWLVTLTLFDPQVYMVFTPGQLRVHQEIGGGEAAYDTAGMVIQKQRNDLFRHWVLGLGSGDLIVNTSGATAHHFDLPNVLFVGYKVRQIETMLREKQVVTG